jgi:hypothetical protein
LFNGGTFDQISLYSTAAQPVARGQNVAVGATSNKKGFLTPHLSKPR